MTTNPRPAPAAAVLEPHRAELERALPHGAGQVPGLAAALVAAQAIDRAVAHLVETLLDLDEHQIAETITGIPLEQWLAIVGRRTRSDRRMLLTACDALRRLPSLRSAFLDEATVSWAQTRAIALAVERLPYHLDDLIDDALADSIPACRQDDPDSLVGVVGRALRSIEASSSQPTAADPPAAIEDYVAMQPRLDGTGDASTESSVRWGSPRSMRRCPRSPRICGRSPAGSVGRRHGPELVGSWVCAMPASPEGTATCCRAILQPRPTTGEGPARRPRPRTPTSRRERWRRGRVRNFSSAWNCRPCSMNRRCPRSCSPASPEARCGSTRPPSGSWSNTVARICDPSCSMTPAGSLGSVDVHACRPRGSEMPPSRCTTPVPRRGVCAPPAPVTSTTRAPGCPTSIVLSAARPTSNSWGHCVARTTGPRREPAGR